MILTFFSLFSLFLLFIFRVSFQILTLITKFLIRAFKSKVFQSFIEYDHDFVLVFHKNIHFCNQSYLLFLKIDHNIRFFFLSL
jgi:hypothetical protein